jgi:hypothetical protein
VVWRKHDVTVGGEAFHEKERLCRAPVKAMRENDDGLRHASAAGILAPDPHVESADVDGFLGGAAVSGRREAHRDRERPDASELLHEGLVDSDEAKIIEVDIPAGPTRSVRRKIREIGRFRGGS